MNKKNIILIALSIVIIWLIYDKAILASHDIEVNNKSTQTIDSLVVFKNKNNVEKFHTKININDSETFLLKINRLQLWQEGLIKIKIYSSKKEWETYIGFHDMGMFFSKKDILNIKNDSIEIK